MKTLFCFCCLSLWGLIQTTGASNTYRGAVVEYNPVLEKDEESRVAKNVANFVSFMTSAKQQNVDIIVFPENGLLTSSILSFIPDPADGISPCDSTFVTTKAVKDLSCASKDNGIYSIVNLMEKRACSKDDKLCPPRGYYIYNTNVGFDRRGVVVARYSKFNLYDEQMTNKTEKPDKAFFDTDFGVRFGIFTCFDILFPNPALKLVQEFNITNFVFTSHWFSELPFLTALQVQKGWAETNNVNLLASGLNYPRTASFGSGIYNGKFGELIKVMPEVPTSTVLIASVPKIMDNSVGGMITEERVLSLDLPHSETAAEMQDEGLEMLRDHMHLFQSEVIQPGKRFDKKICGGDNFCCDFQVSVTSMSPDSSRYTPRAIVFDGVRKFGASFMGGVQCCGVVLCRGPDIMNCTSRVKKSSGMFQFTEIQVKGNFRSRDAFQMPTTLTDGENLEPLTAKKYTFRKIKKGSFVEGSLELVWPVTNLQAFGIWGRDFSRDGKSSAPAVLPTFGFFVTLVLALVSSLNFGKSLL